MSILLPATRRLSFHSFVVLALGTVCVQGIYPTVLAEGFGTTLCILLIYLTVQRPEDLIDGESRLLNKSAFITVLSLKFKQKIAFEAAVVMVDEVAILEQSISLAAVSKLTAAIGTWFHQNVRRATVCRIADGLICLISRQDNKAYMDELISLIMARFGQAWEIGNLSMILPSYFMKINCPKDAKTPEAVMDLIDMLHKTDCPSPALIRLEELHMEEKIRRDEIKRVLHEAIGEGRLEVYYQPIYSIQDKAFRSAEALLRLYHPVLGSVSPDACFL